ncbi:MAG: TonB-dependent receptor [Hyphomonadaceae bacterium]|nr:TonB-dependent receptor [Hyphomonadaceae bacterium]
MAETNEPAAAEAFDEVLVIARRRAEDVQDVPVAVTAIGAEELEQRSLQTTEDLRFVVPALNVGGQRRDEAQFYMRGNGPGPVNAGQRNFTSVAAYFAEVPTEQTGPGVFFDLASVQVLRGPQGTLFGRNTTAGAVLFQPQRPEEEFGGYASASVGDYDLAQFQGVLNVPLISDHLSLRLGADIGQRDGYTRSLVTGQEMDDRNYEGYRASLLWTPTDDFENLTIVNYRTQDTNGFSPTIRAINPDAVISSAGGQPITFGGSAPRVQAQCLIDFASCGYASLIEAFTAGIMAGGFYIAEQSDLDSYLETQRANGVHTNQVDFLQFFEERSLGVTNITTIDLNEHLTFKNIFGYRNSRVSQTLDYEGIPVDLVSQRTQRGEYSSSREQYTNELQLLGNWDGLNWILGGYVEFNEPGDPQALRAGGLRPSIRFPAHEDTSLAAFAHAEYDLSPVLDGLSISGGYRYTWDDRAYTLSIFSLSSVNSDVLGACSLPACPTSGQNSFSDASWDLALQYEVTPDVMTYVSAKRGYRGGGFNFPAPAGSETYAPELLTEYEAGIKADWALGPVRARTNLAIYRDEIEQSQIQQAATCLGGSVCTIVVNAGASERNGGELETQFLLTADLSLSFTASVNDDPAVFAPKEQYTSSLRYTLPINQSLGDVSASLDYAYIGDRESSDPAGGDYPGYSLVNLRGNWDRIAGSDVDLSIFVTNVTDEEYIIGGLPLYSSLGFDSVFYGEPRMVGATLRYNFGQ